MGARERGSVVYARFSAFEVSDSSTVRLPEAGVTLFVGPNNSGKSQSLRDLLGLVARPNMYTGRAIVRVELDKRGTPEGFVEWVLENVPETRTADGEVRRLLGDHGLVAASQIGPAWNGLLLQHIASLFVYHADATSRLTAGNSVPSLNFAKDAISHPLQRAYIDPGVEHDLRLAASDAFAVGLLVDRYAGNVIALRVGEPPEFKHDNGVPSPEYVEQLRKLPLLEEQGDGMRSYLGLLLHILGGAHQITLVDEPEAFLHPPQARLLGRTLAQRTIGSQQLFMATHSVDVVQGVLDADAPVTIVRITREGDVNRAAVLDPDQVKQLWSDPLLRYSNLLDGLFHDAVILCEGDADCRYYNSVLDSMYSSDGDGIARVKKPQLLFSHCGGKGRLAGVTKSLRAISIPVVIIADFDILNDESLLERTVSALGAEFEPMRTRWRRIASALSTDSKPVSKVAMRDAILKSLEAINADTIERRDAEAIRHVVRVESGWDKAKRSGMGAVPQGEAHRNCIELLAELKDIGLLALIVHES